MLRPAACPPWPPDNRRPSLSRTPRAALLHHPLGHHPPPLKARSTRAAWGRAQLPLQKMEARLHIARQPIRAEQWPISSTASRRRRAHYRSTNSATGRALGERRCTQKSSADTFDRLCRATVHFDGGRSPWVQWRGRNGDGPCAPPSFMRASPGTRRYARRPANPRMRGGLRRRVLCKGGEGA